MSINGSWMLAGYRDNEYAAARLDGCNIPKTFLYVMAPLTKSAMVALGIFTAVFAYKDLMWPMIVCPFLIQGYNFGLQHRDLPHPYFSMPEIARNSCQQSNVVV